MGQRGENCIPTTKGRLHFGCVEVALIYVHHHLCPHLDFKRKHFCINEPFFICYFVCREGQGEKRVEINIIIKKNLIIFQQNICIEYINNV